MPLQRKVKVMLRIKADFRRQENKYYAIFNWILVLDREKPTMEKFK